MKIDKLILGEFKTNCYVVSHNNTAFVIDPACNGETIDAFLRKNNCQLKAIFLTHGHQDHIGAVDYLYNIYKCPIIAHRNEHDILTGTVPSKMINIPSFKRENRMIEEILLNNGFVLTSVNVSLIKNSPVFLIASLKNDYKGTLNALNFAGVNKLDIGQEDAKEIMKAIFDSVGEIKSCLSIGL